MMNKDTELLRLEQFVEKLLQRFSALKEERDGLVVERDRLVASVAEKEGIIADHEKTIEEKTDMIATRDKTIAELETQISDKNDERNEISTKVNSIMEQIESWESSLEGGVDECDTAAEDEENPTVNEGSDHSGDGRIQHDLF